MLVRGAVRCGCGGLKNCSAVAETLRSESMVAVSAARAGVINALDGSGAPFRSDALAVVCTHAAARHGSWRLRTRPPSQTCEMDKEMERGRGGSVLQSDDWKLRRVGWARLGS